MEESRSLRKKVNSFEKDLTKAIKEAGRQVDNSVLRDEL